MIRVLVWAKSAIARAGLEAIVQADARLEVARTERDLSDLTELVRACAPDIVLVDGSASITARFPDELQSESVGPAVVALVESPSRGDVLRLLQGVPKSLLLRDSRSAEITAALHAAAEGLMVMSPEILEILSPSGSELAAFDELPPGEPLTSRESEVLALLADGAANKEIAARLRISEHTVKFHVSSILNKLGATTRTEAVTRGYREGLIVI